MNSSNKLTIASIAVVAILFVFISIGISAFLGSFLLIEIGRFVGPVLSIAISLLILIVALLIPLRVLEKFEKSIPKKEFSDLIRRKKKRIVSTILVGVSLGLVISFVSSFFLMSAVVHYNKKINAFVAENASESLQDYTASLTSFLNSNLNSCNNRMEFLFEIDEWASASLLDPWIMNAWDVNRAGIIMYQGWGSCGQAAILLQQVMNDSGYETRRAHFKGVDHEWAEVKNGTKWLIVDPWYIGNLVDIQTLKTAKPAFQKATAVEVLYYNGTVVDASKEHGY